MKFFRPTAHVVSMIATFSLVAHIANAQNRQSSQPHNQSDDSAAITRQENERNFRMLADELRAIREESTRANRERTEREQQQATERRRSSQQAWMYGDDAPVWSNWALAVIAFFAGLVATRAFNHERDAIKMTERADVTIDAINANINQNGLLHTGTAIEVVFKNWGRTRATNVIFKGALGIPGAPEGEETSGPPTIIAAGETAPFGFRQHVIGSHISQPEIDRVNAGGSELHLVGKLTYSDIFSEPHSIDFEGTWERERGVFEMRRNEVT